MKYDIQVSIEAGKTFNLKGGRGYDISSGIVHVDKVVDSRDMDKNEIINWMEVHTQAMDRNDPIKDREAILEDIYRFCVEPWIYYSYVEGNIHHTESEYLPAYIFADHIASL